MTILWLSVQWTGLGLIVGGLAGTASRRTT